MKIIKRGLCIFTFLLLIIVCASCGTKPAENYDFRYGKWGDTIDEILERDNEINSMPFEEKSDEYESEDSTTLKVEGSTIFESQDTTFSYRFEDGELVEGSYILEKVDYADASRLCQNIMAGLTSEYGEPYSSNDLAEDDDSTISVLYSFRTDESEIMFGALVFAGGADLGLDPIIGITWSSLAWWNSSDADLQNDSKN